MILVPKRKLVSGLGDTTVNLLDFATETVISEIEDGYRTVSRIGRFGHRLQIPVGENKYDSITQEGGIGAIIATTQVITGMVSYHDILPVSGSVYLLAYVDSLNDGWVATVTISDAGAVSAVVDSLEFADAITMGGVKLIHIAGDIYAVAYGDSINTNGIIATFTCTNAGAIGAAIISSGNFETSRIEDNLDIIRISGNVYAVVYGLFVFPNQDDGYVTTISIDIDGTVGAVIDTLKFEDTYCRDPNIVRVGTSDYYAIAYEASGDDGWVVTVNIDSAGTIPATITDSLEFDTSAINFPKIFHIDGDYYGVCYGSSGDFGAIATMTISSAGVIPATITDKGYWELTDGDYPDITRLTTDYFGVVYKGVDSDGFVATISVSNTGNVSIQRDVYEFLPNSSTLYPKIIHIAGIVYALFYQNAGNGYIKTINIGNLKAAGYIWVEGGFRFIDDDGTETVVGDLGGHANLTTGVHGVTGVVLGTEDVDDTPVNGAIITPVSSNWAYDHEAAPNPHHETVVSKTEAYTATTSDNVILCDATSAAFAVTLYASSGNGGRKLHIKKTDSTANAVTVDGNASETIDGGTTAVITAQYESITIVCDGSNWHII